jgi:hypothetical protein
MKQGDKALISLLGKDGTGLNDCVIHRMLLKLDDLEAKNKVSASGLDMIKPIAVSVVISFDNLSSDKVCLMTQEIKIPEPEVVATSELKVDDNNPNKMSREQHDRLKASIKKFVFIVPIITN